MNLGLKKGFLQGCSFEFCPSPCSILTLERGFLICCYKTSRGSSKHQVLTAFRKVRQGKPLTLYGIG